MKGIKKTKRLLAMILSVLITVSNLPTAVFAEEQSDDFISHSQEETTDFDYGEQLGDVFSDGDTTSPADSDFPETIINSTFADNNNLSSGIGYAFDSDSKKLTVSSDAGTTAWKDPNISSILETVEITDNVKNIGNFAFSECRKLESVIIPGTVETIGESAFEGCIKLRSLSLSDNLKTIGKGAFSYSGLTSITIPQNLKIIAPEAFEGCDDLNSLTISEGVETIDWDAFSLCTSLTTVFIPKTVTAIGARAFSYCSVLENVMLSDDLTAGIGEQAFYECIGLKSITIPSNVPSIGAGAFSGCTELESMTFISNTAPTLAANDVFNFTSSDLVIYVPEDAAGYDSTNWPIDRVVKGFALPLTALSVSNGTLMPHFRMGQQTYTVNVPAIVESITVKPVSKGTITVNDINVTSGSESGEILLKAGSNTQIEIVVTTNSKLSRSYTITVIRGLSKIDIPAISGVNAPARGEEPVKTITETEQYTGTVSWSPELPSDGRFAAYTEYTATINLSPKERFTLEGVGENFFTVAGAVSVTNKSNSGEIKAVFPRTASAPHIHAYGDWMHDDTNHWRQCSCGYTFGQELHNFSDWIIDKESDAFESGSSSRKCTICDFKQTEKNTSHILTESETGVRVKGNFTSDAAISVNEAELHEEGTCNVCDEIRARKAAGELIALYDISLSSGINNGEMEISIPVDEKYNGQTIVILHCIDKKEERMEVKAENGFVTCISKSLSPFAVLNMKKAESIKLNPSSLTLELGKSRQLQYTVSPSDVYNNKVTWTTSNKNIATVSPSGEINAVKSGTATITCTATDGGGAKAVCKVTVQNTVTPLLILRGTAGKNTIRLNWNQISNADGYEIYGSRCGTNYSYGKIKTITKGTSKTLTQKGLRSATAYKYYIKAYKLVNGKKLYLKTSNTSHVITTGGNYTNVKAVTTTFTDITLAKGKSRQISAGFTPVKKGRKLANHVPQFRYKSTNSKVVTVTSSGKIKAVGKGKCSVYVYANNGVTRRIKITV